MALTRITTNELSNNVVVSFANTTSFAEVSARLDVAYATANTANTNASGVVPKITTVNVANSTYAVLDDTAVNVGGGYLVITGTGFQSGAQVLVDVTPATSTTFVNNTTLRAEVPAKSAATYNLYVVNTDGGTGTKINGLTYSSTPTWVTGSTLTGVTSNVAFTGSLSATGATSYANTTALPTGFNLVTANGYYFGNISVGSTTTYSFTIEARDAENQESARTFSLTASVVLLAPTSVEYLVVAGGGGGGGDVAGGGGAGGYRTGTLSVSTSTPYTVTIGSGGSGAIGRGSRGSQGSSSVFSSITSAGGGGGGSFWPGPFGTAATYPLSIGGSGGSGGGGAGAYFPGPLSNGGGGAGNTPSVSPSQGNNGAYGQYQGSNTNGGGGGGSGAAGSIGGPSAGGDGAGGPGGAGTSNPISGDSVTYAGGGGGGGHGDLSPRTGGPGGAGGGGAGGNGTPSPSSSVKNGSSGTVNTGGGGGGGAYHPAHGFGNGGEGGSGIVIIRYADSSANAVSTTGSPTLTISGGYRIYRFTGSGSITW